MTDNMPVRIIEQPGPLGALKMSQLANLIEAYGIAHPEILAEPENRQENQEVATI
jgi:hypothetical protein